MFNIATRLRCLGWVCLVAGCGVTPGRADVVTNLVCVADTGLWEANPNNNLGGLSPLPVGVTGVAGSAKRGRALFKFPIAGSIPTNALISSAALNLIVTFGHLPGLDHNLYRVLDDWGEGTGSGGGAGSGGHGAPAQPGEATWNARFYPAVLWSAPGAAAGADYLALPSATTAMNISGTNTFTSAALTADVQTWVTNPATNFGWILIQADETILNSGLRIATREDPANAPVLTVNFTLAPPPTPPPAIFQVTLVGNQIRFSFNAESNRTYAVETRASLTAGGWSVVTNIPALPASATVGVTNPISFPQGFFRIRTP